MLSGPTKRDLEQYHKMTAKKTILLIDVECMVCQAIHVTDPVCIDSEIASLFLSLSPFLSVPFIPYESITILFFFDLIVIRLLRIDALKHGLINLMKS
jgi:hypothetical protein